MFTLQGTVTIDDGPGVCGLGAGDGVGVGLGAGVGGGEICAYPSTWPYVGSIVGDMLAYAIETKTFAVGVGDGVGVGDPLAVGVGEATGEGTAELLFEQPPVPTIAAAAAAATTSVMARSGRRGSDIKRFPFTNCSARLSQQAPAPSLS